LKPNQRATVYTLLERGSTQREIARITGIDRKTLRSYQRRWETEQANSPTLATDSRAGGHLPVRTPPRVH
jgi:transcriptional regulator with XRE-family HTH domain